jgi:hypothetical protein
LVRTKSVETIPGGGSVEIPFRVYLSSTGTYRMKVTLDTWDAGAPAGTGNSGSFQLWDNPRSGERTQFSGEFRILPPQ